MGSGITSAVAEGVEFEMLYDWETGVDPDTKKRLGIASLRLGGGGALSVRGDLTQLWTRALGFGFAQPVTRDLIGQVTDFYRDQEAPMAVIQIAPPVLPADWDEICAQANLSAGPKLVKLACETEAALGKTGRGLLGDLHVGPVAPARAGEWSAAMSRVFEKADEASATLAASTVGRPDWHTFAVWAGDGIVATGSVHVHGDTAHFWGGATIPEYRRRGAQTALIAARARAAHAAGCRWLVTEVDAEAPGTHNPSLHNLRRAGFGVLYERTNWIWRPAGAVER